jgi:hypothetical protein
VLYSVSASKPCFLIDNSFSCFLVTIKAKKGKERERGASDITSDRDTEIQRKENEIVRPVPNLAFL